MRPRARPAIAGISVAILVGASGCGGSGEDSPARSGAQLFSDSGCGRCHTLAAAGSRSEVAADLDQEGPDASEARRWIRDGGQGMPAFGSSLSAAEIGRLARFVAAGGSGG